MDRIPSEAIEKLAEVVPHMTYTEDDLQRLLTVIQVPELLDLPDVA